MEKLIKTAVYSIPKLNIKEYCQINNTTMEELYREISELEDDKLANLFLNRYPIKNNEDYSLNGANIIKQILNIRHLKLSEIAQTYNVSKRTILRKIKEIEQSDPELYELYKKLRSNTLTKEDEEKILKMPIEDIQSEERDYCLTKNISGKTHESDKILKDIEEIREEIYSRIAEKCEDPEELERKILLPETEKLVQNRWKKELVLKRIFEEECDNNLEFLHITLGNRDTTKRIQEEFRKIDEQDGIREIIEKTYEVKGE